MFDLASKLLYALFCSKLVVINCGFSFHNIMGNGMI